MLIELGNHSAKANSLGVDDHPKVTTIFVPEFDETGLGGYTHEPGLSVKDFRDHIADAMMFRNGITRLPEHELLLATHFGWPSQADERPAWLQVRSHEEVYGKQVLPDLPEGVFHPRATPHSAEVCQDIENFLHEHFDTGGQRAPADLEDRYWTRFGAPGVGPVVEPPDAQALFTNAGRVMANINDGGGQTGLTGTATSATATTLTTNLTLTTNAWAGYRVYVMQTATGPLLWGNVLSNNNAAGASVVTVDRWYTAATPGGAAPSAPSAGYYFMLADGGSVASWFVGLTTTNITPAAADTALSGEYTVSSGGMIRKIAPYAQTSGVASRSLTLIPVFTANGSDTLPSTFYAIGVFATMSVGTALMKFETSLNASATIAAISDQVTVTETVTGS